MKVTLPEHQGEIELGTYQEYEKIVKDSITESEKEDRVIALFTGIDVEDVKNVTQADREYFINSINTAINTDGEFKTLFKVDSREFGLIPNISKDEITGDEYTDLVKYGGFEWVTMDRLMSVLYRPRVVNDKHGNYDIETYNGTGGHIEQIRKMPLSYAKGALGFFLNLRNELRLHTQQYLKEEQQKEQQL